MKTICFTGGGTAGHVMPNLSIACEIANQYNLIYIGSKNGMEKNIVESFQPSIPFFGIDCGKLKRYFAISNFFMPFSVIKGIFEAKKILKENKVSLVFSKGGFVAVPVVIAAYFQGIPVITHEADITPGLANKICIPMSKKICTSFESTINLLPKNKAVYTGLPIRKEILNGNKEKAIEICGFKNNKKNILVIGGSTGSIFINKLIRNNLDELTKEFNVIHICGKGNISNINNISYKQFEFVDDELKHLYALADLIIARAGANIIFEILALNKLNILIPLSKKVSRGDQILNAKSMEEKNLSYVLEEDFIEQNDNALLEAISYVENNKQQYETALQKYKYFNSVLEIVKIINETLS